MLSFARRGVLRDTVLSSLLPAACMAVPAAAVAEVAASPASLLNTVVVTAT